jgi:MFS family permease
MIYYIVGVFILTLLSSTLLISLASERFGRLSVLRWSLGLTSLFEFFILGSADAYYFIVFLFLMVLPLQANLINPLVYMTEVTSGRSRTVSLGLVLTGLALGSLPAYLIVFYMKSWRPIVLASLVSGTLALVFTLFLVESPRYLGVIRARFSKARAGLEYIAKTNKKTMFEDHLQGEILNEYSETIRKRQGIDLSGLDNSELPDLSEQRDAIAAPFEYLGGAANAVDRERDLDRGQKYSFLDLFKEDLRKPVLCLSFIWAVSGCAGYSISNSGIIIDSEEKNAGLIVLISSSGIITGSILGLLTSPKRSLQIALPIAGIFAVIQGSLLVVEKNNSAFFTVTFFFISCLLPVLVKYSLELLPTPCRCIGFGFFQFTCLLGTVAGFFIGLFAPSGIIAFGVCLTVSPILLLKLPETEGNLNDFAAWSMI